MRSHRLRPLLLGLVCVALGAAASAQTRRPTPHEAITRNLGPVTDAARDAAVTDAERARLADVFDRAEATAAEMVEAERHADHAAVRARRRRMELLARLLRARVDAMRAEVDAEARERAVLAADERRVEARGALERAAERRLSLAREGSLSSFTLPPPDVDAGAAAGDAGGAR